MTQTSTPPYVTLTLRNPSPVPRQGFVVRDWHRVSKALGVRARGAIVERELDPGNPSTSTVPLLAQIDRLDPRDRRHDQLVFKLDENMRPGDEHYGTDCGTVRVRCAKENDPPVGVSFNRKFTGVTLTNQHLELWLNTDAVKYPHKPNDSFYGGAVTSVILQREAFPPFTSRLESVDAIQSRAGMPPHPEARAMQLDRIHLVRPPWDDRHSVDFFPYKYHWTIVSVSAGPVRAVATIMSQPFDFRCKDIDGTDHLFRCNVYRALSLYDGADWMGDEVWVKARDAGSGRSQRLWFTGRFFMMVQFTDELEIFRYPDHPGWFCITPKHQPTAHPHLGYAFATDAMAGAIWNPPLDYHDKETRHRAFSWELGTSRAAHCVHKFRCRTTRLEIGHDAGSLWYDLAFKRIRATLAGEK
jgi:hypothetical protein